MLSMCECLFKDTKKKSLSTEVSQPFVCAENTKSTKTIVNFWELFFFCTQQQSVIGICAPRAISPLMNEVVEPRFLANVTQKKAHYVSVCWRLRN